MTGQAAVKAHALDAGPERRARMLAEGMNLSPYDYTADEWAEIQADAERSRAVRAARRKARSHSAA